MNARLRVTLLLFGIAPSPWIDATASARVAVVAGGVVATPAADDPAPPRPLDHDSYDRWNTITARTLSADGRWLAHVLHPGKEGADDTLVIAGLESKERYEVRRGRSLRFSADGRFAVYLVAPDPAAVKAAKKEKKKDEEQPKAKLEILELATGATTTIARVKSFQVPEKQETALAYLLEKPLGEEAETAAERVDGEKPAEGASGAATTGEAKPEEKKEEQAAEEPPEKEAAKDGKKDKPEGKRDAPGTTLVLRDFATGAEHRYTDVASYGFDEQGTRLYYLQTPEEEAADSVHVVTLRAGVTGTALDATILSGKGKYEGFHFDESGQQLAFLSTRDEAAAKTPERSLYYWYSDRAEATRLAHSGTAGMPKDWWLSEYREPTFSRNGTRIFVGTAPRPPRKEGEGAEDEKKDGDTKGSAAKSDDTKGDDEAKKVVVDIWNWQDPLLQPMQLKQVEQEKRRNYLACFSLPTQSFLQLATLEIPNVTVGAKGDADVALAESDLPYRQDISWDSPVRSDSWLIDVPTGKATALFRGLAADLSLSPTARYVTWYDRVEQDWYALDVTNREPVNLTEMLPYPTYDEDDDHPWLVGPYGAAGWTQDDQAFVIYDRFDLWATNPSGFWPPFCLTDGHGREHDLQFRFVSLDREAEWLPSDEPLLLSAFDEDSKSSGYFEDRVRSNERPRQLLFLPERVGSPTKARDADRLLLTRETFRQFPDLWVTDRSFAELTRVSDANPQQKEYLWGTSELFEWTSTMGDHLQGILQKPDGFDATKKYPLLVYFYERNSQNLHQYTVPAPGSSSINRSFYTSRGYLVFVPDIPYRIGYPGESAEAAVLPGIARLIDQGFVDQKRIGVQGHSWGGYQVAHLVTATKLFACAEAGAPVSNMTSAYGGIRWGTGMSRMFQYERSQSRIGGTLWESLPRYLENSPLFDADKIVTPLLILHNDQDGAVPWYQGIELFVALRRLGKPCWMINYNGEDHGLRQEHNRRDWTIRLQQFFDHYLMNAPPPVWLAKGVPAIEKGENLGLDLVEEKGAGDGSK